VPRHVLVGYWHNFDNGSGFIPLSEVSTAWNVIEVAFAEPTSSSTDGTIGFTPYESSDADFIQEVDYLHSLGDKVLISIGGANGQVELETSQARQNFVQSMIHIIEKYHFDGMDIDFEGHSLHLDDGDTDIKNPTTPVIVNTIAAIRAIHDHFGSDFVLTMAPETFFVQLGYSFYGGNCISCDTRAGAFLPVIYNLRDILSWLQVQDYNSGPITGLDDQYHTMGNADFHVAMLDMLLAGFPVAGTNETFPPLRPDQVVLGVPASTHAGNGYVSPAGLQKALDYVIRGKSFGGYALRSDPADNADFRGVMAWSINWDAFGNFDFTNGMRPYIDGLP
jgi:chitinase